MKNSILALTVSLALVSSASVYASTPDITLDNFNTGTATGVEQAGTSWVSQVVQNATTITVGGSAMDDNGWGNPFVTVNATGLNFLEIIGQRDTGNAAATFTIQFEDISLNTQVLSISTSAFNLSSMNTVYIPVSWTGGFDMTQITGWTIGGGTPSPGSAAFRMTFDNMALVVSAVPEPATYALLLGLACFGLIAVRRRMVKA